MGHIWTAILLALLTASLWLFERELYGIDVSQWKTTAVTITLLYIVFKVVLEGLVAGQISSNKSRYIFRKVVSLTFIVVAAAAILRVWVEDPSTLAVAYGLIAAGVAISLQDLFKNFVGGLILIFSRPYSVGDRIEVEGKYGDVLDIGLINTTLLEIQAWVDGDQATGRLSIIPNGAVLSDTIFNYTKDHGFMWDEITIPVTYESDWKTAKQTILDLVAKETREATETAEKDIERIGEKYYLSKRNIEPAVYLSLTDNWIELSIRYVVEIRDRRLVNDLLMQKILEAVQSSPNVDIASSTITVTTRKVTEKENN